MSDEELRSMKFVLFSPRKRFVCGTPALGSASRMRSTLENFDAFENNLDSDYHIFADYVDESKTFIHFSGASGLIFIRHQKWNACQ